MCDIVIQVYYVQTDVFRDIGDVVFRTEGSFTRGMCRIICDAAEFMNVPIPEKYRTDFEKLWGVGESKENSPWNIAVDFDIDMSLSKIGIQGMLNEYEHDHHTGMDVADGERYNAEGEKQICDYLDHFGLSTGYMLSFNFNKKKETGVKQVQVGDKLLYEGTV